MRRTIADPAFNRRPIAVEADTICDLVVLEVDGKSFSFAPDVARRIGQAMLLAAGVIGRPELPPYDLGDDVVESAGEGPAGDPD